MYFLNRSFALVELIKTVLIGHSIGLFALLDNSDQLTLIGLHALLCSQQIVASMHQ